MSESLLLKYFAFIDDPRQKAKVINKLFYIIALPVSAVILGCQGWESIEDFGRDRLN